MTTTRACLADRIADQAALPLTQANEGLQILLDEIVKTLNRGEKVEICSFGSFRVRERAPRIGRNPKTGESVKIPAKRIPYFKLGKDLKVALIEYAVEPWHTEARSGHTVWGLSSNGTRIII